MFSTMSLFLFPAIGWGFRDVTFSIVSQKTKQLRKTDEISANKFHICTNENPGLSGLVNSKKVLLRMYTVPLTVPVIKRL